MVRFLEIQGPNCRETLHRPLPKATKKKSEGEGAPAPEGPSLSHFHHGDTTGLGAAGQFVVSLDSSGSVRLSLDMGAKPWVIWGVIVSIYNTIAQGKTVGPKDIVIRVKDCEVDYLLTHLARRITIPFRYAAKTPSIRGPFEEDVMPYKVLTSGVEECEHGGGW